MLTFHRHTLENGLTLIVHEDSSTPMATVNVLYDVGARDEDPEKTGFAHLFEHLMFGGSLNIPEFDAALQQAGGESNAFTNNDITNYYDVVPAYNLETALWLESDRMLQLDFSQASLEVQRKVVIEEFKENYINKPYGDVWHAISELVYKSHPYRWPTIGKNLKHIEDATLEDVQDFFFSHYRPNKAILVVAGNVSTQKVVDQVEKWFGDIPSGKGGKRDLPQEAKQEQRRTKTLKADVPLSALYMAYKMPERNSPEYYAMDLLSDVLGSGRSSRLIKSLVEESQIFNSVGAYVTGTFDQGMFAVEGKLVPGVEIEHAENEVNKILQKVCEEMVEEKELEKVKNKAEAQMIFGETSILNKAMNLAFYEKMGDAELHNAEIEAYSKVKAENILQCAQEFLRPEACSALHYQKN